MEPGRPDYGDPAAELRAALGAVVLADMSSLARLVGTGPDLLGLLQRLSTGDVARLEPGNGAATVLTTPKGRIVQRLFVSHLGDAGILLVGGAGGAGPTLEHLKRYTFSEDTGLGDRTGETCMPVLSGPEVSRALAPLGLEPLPPLEARHVRLAGNDVVQLGCDGVSAAGCAFVAPTGLRDAVWETLREAVQDAGGRAAGTAAFEAARVLRGLGRHGHELTEDYNPLEAGLRDAISFTKGCYVGQEVVARLENYDKVARTLFGVEFPREDAPPPPGTSLYADGREVGRVTSALTPTGLDRGIGLASVKHRAAGPGDALAVGEAGASRTVRLVALPFPETTVTTS